MIDIYCDTEDEMNALKETILHSEDCPLTALKKYPCKVEISCIQCISESINWHLWHLNSKGGEN